MKILECRLLQIILDTLKVKEPLVFIEILLYFCSLVKQSSSSPMAS